MACEGMGTTSRLAYKDVSGTVSVFFPHQLAVGTKGSLGLKMAKPGPPGSLSNCIQQSPTPTPNLRWSKRGHLSLGSLTSGWKCSFGLQLLALLLVNHRPGMFA